MIIIKRLVICTDTLTNFIIAHSLLKSLHMYRILFNYPLGLASVAATANKITQFQKNKIQLTTSLAIATLSQLQPAFNKQMTMLDRLNVSKPRGLKKIIIYILRFI
jgi:hypothetical protein